jgi:hypothetical protein
MPGRTSPLSLTVRRIGLRGCLLGVLAACLCAGSALANPPQYTLTVTVTGPGTVNGSGLNCPGTCSVTYTAGAQIVIWETPASGSKFSGWGGDCSGNSTSCDVVLTADRTATATFVTPAPPTPPAGNTPTGNTSPAGRTPTTPAVTNKPAKRPKHKTKPKHKPKHKTKPNAKGFASGPTVATLTRMLCASTTCDAKHELKNVTIIKTSTPHWGSGRTARVGGDGVASNVAVYPITFSYDFVTTETVPQYNGVGPLTYVTTVTTRHTRERHDMLREPDGNFRGNIKAATSTCDPPAAGCGTSFGGGA